MIVPPEEALPVGDGRPGVQIALPGLEPVIESTTLAPPNRTQAERIRAWLEGPEYHAWVDGGCTGPRPEPPAND